MSRDRADAVIVGLGAAGGVLAKELTTAGLQVVALERGALMGPSELHVMDELGMTVRGGLWANANQLITRRLDRESPSVIVNSQAAGVGGATLHWAALIWRFHEEDFYTRTSTLERYGEEALPPGNLVADWPMRYGDLAPFYEQAEGELGVSGVWAHGGGNPFDAPRDRDFPLPPLLDDAASRTFREGALKLGYHPFPGPAGILSRDYTGPLGIARRGCQYCGFCRHHACIVDAKTSSLVSVIPVARATGRLDMRTGCTAMRVNVDATGTRARSVSYYDPQGALREVEAGLVFVAAGSVAETVRLLLLSTSDHHPAGLGNASNWLGKGFAGHMRPSVVALYDDRVLNSFIGPNHANDCIDDLNADHFDHTGLGFLRGGVVFQDVYGSGGPLSFSEAVPPDVPRWGSAYKAYVSRYFTRHLSIGAWLETLPHEGAFVDLDAAVRDRFGLPVARITAKRQPQDDRLLAFMLDRMMELAAATGASKSWVQVGAPLPDQHQAGGTRMGNDPEMSVTNAWGQVWDVPNVFVASASLFPSLTGLNPTLTIFALAYRQAAFVLREAAAGGSLARYL